MNGNTLGHFAIRPYRGWRVHLIQVRDDGAGSVYLAATCNGIEPWIRVDSSVPREDWEEWKQAQAPIKGWPEWSTIKRVDCPRCEATYAKRRAKALAPSQS